MKLKLIICISILLIHGNACAQYWLYLNREANADEVRLMLEKENCLIYGYSGWEHALASAEPITHEKIVSVRKMGNYRSETQSLNAPLPYGRSDWQLNMLGLDSFHRLGFTGKGITIALMDAGFYRVDSISSFDSLRSRGQILMTYDVANNDSSVYEDDAHGMSVLSILAAWQADSMIGAAPDANYLLFRTEIAGSEKHIEEYHWIKGMEMAYDAGADIIHSSLGYSLFDSLEGDYTYFDMNGKSTLITRATDSAHYRGIFVSNSAGNSGTQPWKYITAPCDGKNVLCTGAVDSFGQIAEFSSKGPSADGRVKPEVVALGRGTTIVGSDGTIRTGNGTSFSGPLIAGMVACLKQAHPQMSNERIREAIIRSGNRFQNPDTAYGYGIPNVLVADSLLKRMSSSKVEKSNHVQIFPNPGGQEVHVISSEPVLDIRCINALGSQMQVQNELISTQDWPVGLYYFFIRTTAGFEYIPWLKIP